MNNRFISGLFIAPITRSSTAHGFANEVAERLPRQDLMVFEGTIVGGAIANHPKYPLVN